jgi:hypothetical protein
MNPSDSAPSEDRRLQIPDLDDDRKVVSVAEWLHSRLQVQQQDDVLLDDIQALTLAGEDFAHALECGPAGRVQTHGRRQPSNPAR